jgi:hypothetical protein
MHSLDTKKNSKFHTCHKNVHLCLLCHSVHFPHSCVVKYPRKRLFCPLWHGPTSESSSSSQTPPPLPSNPAPRHPEEGRHRLPAQRLWSRGRQHRRRTKSHAQLRSRRKLNQMPPQAQHKIRSNWAIWLYVDVNARGVQKRGHQDTWAGDGRWKWKEAEGAAQTCCPTSPASTHRRGRYRRPSPWHCRTEL